MAEKYSLRELLTNKELRWQKGLVDCYLTAKDRLVATEMIKRGFELLFYRDFAWVDGLAGLKTIQDKGGGAGYACWFSVWDCPMPELIRTVVAKDGITYFVQDYDIHDRYILFNFFTCKTENVLKEKMDDYRPCDIQITGFKR